MNELRRVRNIGDPDRQAVVIAEHMPTADVQQLVAMDEIDASRRQIQELRHALTGLLDFTDRHRATLPEHGHDCYELWKIEQEYAQQLLREAT